MRHKLHLYDTTLRDGAQTSGVDFSLADKIKVVDMLERLGIKAIEGGYPGANPLDTEFFSTARTQKATFSAFGMIARPGRSASNDPGLQALLQSSATAICLVGKSWDYHVTHAIGCSLEDNLRAISGSVRCIVESGREALFDCEHFFDGYKANPDYAMDCVRAALDAGARWAVLCDTNGGTLPEEISSIIKTVGERTPPDRLGIHAHNDTGHAAANSLAAIRAGVRHIQGTLNGLGERCGNVDWFTLLPTLALKEPWCTRFDTGIDADALAQSTAISRELDDLVNRAPDRQRPYVGAAAFVTKAGIHASAIVKNPATYEHTDPARIGNMRDVLISDQAGKSNLLSELDRIGLAVRRDDPRIGELLELVKTRQAAGYSYEAARASFELLARRIFCPPPQYFTVNSFRVMVERRHNALGQLVTMAEAVVRLTVEGKQVMSVAEGNGPVNALDIALRKDLGIYQEKSASLELVDYKVRIMGGGTTALTRVLVETRDTATGQHWQTIGVSPNIVDASFQALEDSLVFALIGKQAG